MTIELNASFCTLGLFSSGSIAFYSWGAGELVFGATSAQSQEFKLLTLAETLGFSASDRQGVLATICLIHEYRHLQQDFIFGIGAWDYWYRCNAIRSQLGLIKRLCRFESILEPGLLDALCSKASNIGDREVDVPVFHRSERSELVDLRVECRRLGIPDVLAGLFTTRRLLELDAVLYTNNIVWSTKWKKGLEGYLKDLSYLYSVPSMPVEYSETLMMLLGELNTFFLCDLPEVERLDVFFQIIKLFVAMSFAHPDPLTMQELNLTKMDCIPGVRLLRMLRAFSMRGDWPPLPSRDFELELVRQCGVGYPLFREYLAGWVAYFEIRRDLDPFDEYGKVRAKIFEKRLAMCEGKVDHCYEVALRGEPLDFILDNGLSMFSKNLDGTPSPVTLTGGSFANEYYEIDRTRHVNAWRLVEFFQGRHERFHCIFGDAGLCTDQRPHCKVGFLSPSEFPRGDDCRVSKTVHDESSDTVRF